MHTSALVFHLRSLSGGILTSIPKPDCILDLPGSLLMVKTPPASMERLETGRSSLQGKCADLVVLFPNFHKSFGKGAHRSRHGAWSRLLNDCPPSGKTGR